LTFKEAGDKLTAIKAKALWNIRSAFSFLPQEIALQLPVEEK
jgi:hypothetical protein